MIRVFCPGTKVLSINLKSRIGETTMSYNLITVKLQFYLITWTFCFLIIGSRGVCFNVTFWKTTFSFIHFPKNMTKVNQRASLLFRQIYVWIDWICYICLKPLVSNVLNYNKTLTARCLFRDWNSSFDVVICKIKFNL